VYYFDNSATTLVKPPQVAEAVFHAIQDHEYANPSRGSHGPAVQALLQVERTRRKTAQFFNVPDPSFVSFTPNATYTLNFLLQSLFQSGDAVITTMQEHNSVLRPLYQLEKKGVEVRFMTLDEKGQLRLGELEKLVQENTRAIIVNHLSNVTGQVADLVQIGAFCRDHDLWLLVDAAQSAGVIPIDMQEMQIDALCFTGHKSLYGPQGTGGLCVNNPSLPFKPVFSGGSGFRSFEKEMFGDMPGIFETGTQNVPGLAGLEAGIEYVLERGVAVIQQELQELTRIFIEEIYELPGMHLYGVSLEQLKEAPETHGPIVSLNLEGWESDDLADVLFEEYGIAVRAGAHCAPLVHESFRTKEQGMVRFSFSSFNTEEEIRYAASTLRKIAVEQ